MPTGCVGAPASGALAGGPPRGTSCGGRWHAASQSSAGSSSSTSSFPAPCAASLGAQDGTEGDFLDGATVPGGSENTYAVALGDLDGDLDAVVGNYSSAATQLLVNQGGAQGGTEGNFGNEADVVTLPGGSQFTWAVALGDLDGDGSGGLTASGLHSLGSKLPIVADVDWVG